MLLCLTTVGAIWRLFGGPVPGATFVALALVPVLVTAVPTREVVLPAAAFDPAGMAGPAAATLAGASRSTGGAGPPRGRSIPELTLADGQGAATCHTPTRPRHGAFHGMFDPPWWFLFVVLAINLPWFAGVALLGACLPRPGVRWWWRLAGFIAGGVVAAAGMWLASWILWDVVGAGMAAHRALERTVWAVNAAAAVAAAALVVQRRRR